MVNSSVLISIIVPVYNAESTLRRCIDSILSQTYSTFELILVDDGSTDTSLDICNEYAQKDERIIVCHKPNGGASSARNLGIDQARGELITFCDSDDWVLDKWLVTYVENISCMDMICQGIILDKSQLELPLENNEARFEYIGDVKGLLDRMHQIGVVGYTVVKAFKASILKNNNIRFNEKYSYHEDEEFILRYLVHCNSVISVSVSGYNYVIPDFERKYPIIKNAYDLYRSLYGSSIAIYGKCNSKYVESVFNSLIYYFVEEFERKNLWGRWLFMINNRKLFLPNILKSNMFFLSRWIIFLDVSCIMSTLLLSFHIQLKSYNTRDNSCTAIEEN